MSCQWLFLMKKMFIIFVLVLFVVNLICLNVCKFRISGNRGEKTQALTKLILMYMCTQTEYSFPWNHWIRNCGLLLSYVYSKIYWTIYLWLNKNTMHIFFPSDFNWFELGWEAIKWVEMHFILGQQHISPCSITWLCKGFKYVLRINTVDSTQTFRNC